MTALNNKTRGVAKKHLQTVALYVAANLDQSGEAKWLQKSGGSGGTGMQVIVNPDL